MLDSIRIEKIISVPIPATNFFFFEVSALLDYDLIALLGIFSMVLPLPVVKQCSKLSFYAISRKTNEPTLKKLQKT